MSCDKEVGLTFAESGACAGFAADMLNSNPSALTMLIFLVFILALGFLAGT